MFSRSGMTVKYNTLKSDMTIKPKFFVSDLESVWECGCGCFSKYFFHLEIYQNNVFLFFKNYFWYQRIKMI